MLKHAAAVNQHTLISSKPSSVAYTPPPPVIPQNSPALIALGTDLDDYDDEDWAMLEEDIQRMEVGGQSKSEELPDEDEIMYEVVPPTPVKPDIQVFEERIAAVRMALPSANLSLFL